MLGYSGAYALCMDSYRGRGPDLHTFFGSAVDAAELSFSRCAIFARSGKPYGIYRIGRQYQEHNHCCVGLLVNDNGFIKL